MERAGSKDVRPIPDPTELTTDALNREITAVRELVFGEIRHRGQLTDTQFNAIERTIDARFASIAKQFESVELRTAEQKADTRSALDAALAAAKDAVRLQTEASELAQAKSEAAFTKQIDAILLRVEQVTVLMDGKIAELKERMDRLEGKSTGIGSSWQVIVAIVGIIGVALAIYTNSR